MAMHIYLCYVFVPRSLLHSLYEAGKSDVIDALHEIVTQESLKQNYTTPTKPIDCTDSGENKPVERRTSTGRYIKVTRCK